jgi:hypothetical protein
VRLEIARLVDNNASIGSPMAKSPSSGRLSQEAEDIITLGQLLQRPRDEAQRHAVDGVVASGLTVREKIQEIRKLDAGGKQEAEEEKDKARRTRPLRYRLPALADILKKPYSRTPYLTYLFGDYRRILNFGKLTGVFEPFCFFSIRSSSSGLRSSTR